ncbi:MAG: hypothetical protein IT446_02480 [Phycisphaerales bacterium]|nr:hypothetical protein [Phycisphaerales bacterium]
MSNEPRILPGCTVLPPMEDNTPRPPRSSAAPPKGRNRKGDRRKTGDRFGVLNAFVDAGLADLTRTEALTWLVLYRDTRNGTARTSAADIARRIGASKRAVLSAIGTLQQQGQVKRIYRGGMNRGVSVYSVHSTPKMMGNKVKPASP